MSEAPPSPAVAYLTRKEADMAFKRRAWTLFEWLGDTSGKTLLDCGCGRGFYLKMLRHLGNARLFGVDLELPYLGKARSNLAGLPGALVANASVYRLPFPDAFFDAVLLSEVLEHLERDADGLAEVYRVLKPGGLALITVPHADYPFLWDPLNKSLETLFGTHIGKGPLAGIWAYHVRLYTPEELRAATLAAGFTVEAERSFTHHCFPFVHNLLYGLGKPLLESGIMGKRLTAAADRGAFEHKDGDPLHPVTLGLRLLNWIDRRNRMNEPPGRSTVNLCLKARKPASANEPQRTETQEQSVDDAAGDDQRRHFPSGACGRYSHSALLPRVRGLARPGLCPHGSSPSSPECYTGSVIATTSNIPKDS